MTNARELWAQLVDFVYGRGVTRICYYHVLAPSNRAEDVLVITDGFSDAFVKRYYDEELFRVDPLTAYAKRALHPFFWSEIGKHVKLSADQQSFLDIMAEHGHGDGFAFQVFGPGLRNGCVGMGLPASGVDTPQEDLLTLQSVAQAAHVRFCELSPKGLQSGHLSPRERQILGWIARGKSNAAIARQLTVSPHTVDTLVRRIFEKMGVKDRTTAAIQGVGSGVVPP